ncbi:MAG: glycosyltransferase family 2 protein [Lachnospiraceae bacterium]|nr:glycosyltransferase family 2 protein [Lachnospiraceae bacterium]
MENNRPLVTCVITSYKRNKETVERALQSVLAQTYSPIEVFIIDDNRGEGAESYSRGLSELAEGSDLVSVIKTENGHGGQRARNTGIGHARGKYVAFLDDDDEWLPEKLEIQIPMLEEDPEVGLCYSRGYLINEAFDPPRVTEFKSVKNATYEDLLKDDGIGSTTQAVIPRAVFDKVGMFDESFPARQDYEMWIRISKSYKTAGSDKCLYKYHKSRGTGQVSHKWKSCLKGHRLIYEKYKDDIDRIRDAKFNVVFHEAHYLNEGANEEKDPALKLKAVFKYVRAFFTSPSQFFVQAGYRLRKLKGNRRGLL